MFFLLIQNFLSQFSAGFRAGNTGANVNPIGSVRTVMNKENRAGAKRKLD